MRLRSLIKEAENPTQCSRIVQALDQIGIRTDADFLFGWPATELFDKLQNSLVTQPSESHVTYEEFYDFRDRLLKKLAVPASTGDVELEREMNRLATVPGASSGVEEIDSMTGGFGRCEVMEVAGATGSGKTVRRRFFLPCVWLTLINPTSQLLLFQVVLRYLSNHNEASALWLDTTGEFSAERAREMMEFIQGPVSLPILSSTRFGFL